MATHTNSSTFSKQGTAVITGASTGIGAVYAHRFAKRGYDVLLVARDQNRLTALAEEITTATGRKAEVLAADLTLKADLHRVETRLRSDDTLTALVNNAGFGATSKLIDSDVDDLENMIQLNVTALTRLTSAILPGLIERGTGLIINIASIVAVSPELLNGVYGGTKAFVVALTQSLHNEVKDKGITVQAVLPGATSTEFWDRAKLPVHNLPAEIVMTADEMVDASLAGLDQGELITIPSLPELDDWKKFEEARKALGPNLSRKHSALRYGVGA
ncbi:SDR family NAD(P)-dependent oxidoreductase [Acidicapsa ligni]|uniref:SDR family NAD(P)-dependent oxidoreductase n=1 Tax=Acidicapsa ligni TaxID=542300 RepID=UPI0021E09328|nr:SDR family oxidoreductase [Acidicapsa ligni]